MNNVARKGLVTAVVAGGVLATAGYAQADSTAKGGTAGSPGVLSGNTAQVPVDVPVNVCGNTLSVVGVLNPAMGNACANRSAAAPAGGPTMLPVASRQDAASAASKAPRTPGSARPARHSGQAAAEPAHAGSAGTQAQAAGSESSDGAQAAGRSAGSPGLLSGNLLQLPLHLPVNIVGNSLNAVGIGNPAFGNTGVNGPDPAPPATPAPNPAPVPAPPAHAPIPAPPNPAAPAQPAAPANGAAPVAGAPALAHTGTDGLGYLAGASAGLLGGGVLLHRRFRPGRG